MFDRALLLTSTLCLAAVLAPRFAAADAAATQPSDGPQVLRLWEGNAPGARQGVERQADQRRADDHRLPPPPGKATGPPSSSAPAGATGSSPRATRASTVAEWFNTLGAYRASCSSTGSAPSTTTRSCSRTCSAPIRTRPRHAAGSGASTPSASASSGFSAGGHLASTAATHFDAGDPKAVDPVDR